MQKNIFLKWILFLPLVFSLFFGCAGKDVKTTQGDPGALYQQGLNLFNKRNYGEALKIFEQLKSNFPDSPPYTIQAELKVGDCHFFKKEYLEAIAAYEEFKKIHPTHDEIPYVQYQIGMAYFNQMLSFDRDQTSTRKALSHFEYLIANYPPNLFTEKTIIKMDVCKKRLAGHEFYIGNYYYKRGNFQAAAVRFEELLKRFPKSPEEDETLYLLGESYFELEQWEKAKEAFAKMVNEYPKSSHYKEAKSILEKGRIEAEASPRKAKAEEAKKRSQPAEADPERVEVALIKFEDERKRPLSLDEKKIEPKKGEEEKVPPPDRDTSKKLVPPKEETKKTNLPLPQEQMQEDRTQATPEEAKRKEPAGSVGLTKEEGPKAETKIELTPHEEKRMAALPSAQSSLKKEEKPKKDNLLESGQDGFVDTSEPMDISSDRVEAHSRENLIVFKGNVVARQKDIVIYADSIEAVILKDGKGIERVIADGNVKIQQGLRAANCQRAVFYNLDQKVVLTGNPKVLEGKNIISGNEIVFDIQQNRIQVKGGMTERGKAKIDPEEVSEKEK
ncbi:MAG: lipopolysaccharide transport periplasmic protein LptA [Deltaproteobacteria bacterium RBG_13_47_9]|nr:MAG: lipopolysaccharide transport periplasmic protein LptA [Deltaproteobacteria bacterium RBG_13_47_9]